MFPAVVTGGGGGATEVVAGGGDGAAVVGLPAEEKLLKSLKKPQYFSSTWNRLPHLIIHSYMITYLHHFQDIGIPKPIHIEWYWDYRQSQQDKV